MTRLVTIAAIPAMDHMARSICMSLETGGITEMALPFSLSILLKLRRLSIRQIVYKI